MSQTATITATEKQGDHYLLPDAATLEKAYQLNVTDQHGVKHSFKSVSSGENGNRRRLVVFIRHFFCGQCENYIHALTASLPPPTLATVSTDLILIGCGQPILIEEYAKRTQSPFTIYSDPDRALYDTLGMITNLAMGEKKPEYITSSTLGNVLSSAWTGLKSGTKFLGAGKLSQNGGEWLFSEGQLIWCRRMRNTTDHSEIVELKEVLGVTQS